MKYQYRIWTDTNWQSCYGYGILVIRNPSGSGRKLTLRSMEVQVNSHGSPTQGNMLEWVRSSEITNPSMGESLDLQVCALDSTYSVPATVKTWRGAPCTGTVIRALPASYSGIAAGNLFTIPKCGPFRANALASMTMRSTSPVESIFVPPGESIGLAVYNGTLTSRIPQRITAFRVHVWVRINGHTFVWNFFARSTPGVSVFALSHAAGSSDVVEIVEASTEDFGTADTPYYRLVPIGNLYAEREGDAWIANIGAQPMDSDYPDLNPNWCKIYSDVPFTPAGGVPESYLTDTTAGTPRGFNYLQTKDFNGPCFKTLFPEVQGVSAFQTSNATENLGQPWSFRQSDIGVRNAGLVLNQGEGVAIVASCESATGFATFSGWVAHTFGAFIDVEPASSPYLTFTGLADGTEVRIMGAGTNTELAGVEAVTGGAFAWNYDPDLISSVDVNIVHNQYQVIRYEGLTLDVSGATIPIVQQIDRQYLNP